MTGLPENISEKHIIGPGCSEWLVSARQLRPFQERAIEWAGISHVRAPYEIVRFHPPFGHVVAALAGEGEVWIDGEWRAVTAGRVFLNPADFGEAMRVRPGKDWLFCWLHLGADFRPSIGRQRLDSGDGRGLNAALEGLRVAFKGDATDPLIERWCEMVGIYTSILVREGADGTTRLARLWDAVNREPEALWTIDGLARAAHMSREHLRRVCIAETGRSPMQHVAYLRMQRAMNLLLSSERTVETVAESVGYANPFVFSNAFQKWVGERPGAFRRAHGTAAGVVLRAEAKQRTFAWTAQVRPGRWRSIDLSKVANRSLTQTGAAWFDGKPFPAFPPEIRGLYGVNFRAVADRMTGECRMLLMESARTRRESIADCRSQQEIPVGSRAKALYFLHAAAWVGLPGPVATYRVRYENGMHIDIPILAYGTGDGRKRTATERTVSSLQDWYPHCEPFSNAYSRSVMVTQPSRGDARCGRVYVFEWRNPRPAERVLSIAILTDPSAEVTFGLLALSALLSGAGRRSLQPKRGMS